MKLLIFSAMLIFSYSSFAHEGHGPVQKMAPHGGVLKDGKALMAELVQDASGVKIYLINHDHLKISILKDRFVIEGYFKRELISIDQHQNASVLLIGLSWRGCVKCFPCGGSIGSSSKGNIFALCSKSIGINNSSINVKYPHIFACIS